MHEPGPAEYPRTKRTWISSCLGGGGGALVEVRRHVMEVYVEPLQAQLRARWRMSAAEALDLVHGFFASRLSRDEYLQQWRVSGLPLRRWLWNGLCYHMREGWRAQRKLPLLAELPELPDHRSPEPASDYDRQCLLRLAQVALVQAEQMCRDEGFGRHWELFAECRLGGVRIVDVAARRGVTRLSIVPLLRVPERRFREAFQGMLELEGVPMQETARVAAELLAGL